MLSSSRLLSQMEKQRKTKQPAKASLARYPVPGGTFFLRDLMFDVSGFAISGNFSPQSNVSDFPGTPNLSDVPATKGRKVAAKSFRKRFPSISQRTDCVGEAAATLM